MHKGFPHFRGVKNSLILYDRKNKSRRQFSTIVGEYYFFSKHLVPDSETQYSIIVCFSSSGKVLLIMKERFSHFMGVGNFINIVRINTDYRSIDDRPLKR